MSCSAGQFIAALSDRLPTGVFIAEGSAVAPNAVDDPLAALNEALSPAGCTIKVARGVKLAEPITVVHLTTEPSSHSVYSRTAIALDVGAQASFVEIFDGAHAGVQRHAATIMTLADGARATHVAVVGDEPGLHIETQICEVAETAKLAAFGLVSGGEVTRRQIFVRLAGDEAKLSLGGLALIDGARRADTTLAGRSCCAGRDQPRILSRDRRRRRGRSVSGKDYRRESGAKDRWRDEVPSYSPVSPMRR